MTLLELLPLAALALLVVFVAGTYAGFRLAHRDARERALERRQALEAARANAPTSIR